MQLDEHVDAETLKAAAESGVWETSTADPAEGVTGLSVSTTFVACGDDADANIVSELLLRVASVS